MFPFLHCHSKASSMSQPWMILLPQKKTDLFDLLHTFGFHICRNVAAVVRLSFGRRHEDVAIFGLAGEKTISRFFPRSGLKKSSRWPDFGPPEMDDRKRPARKLSGDEGSAVSGEGLTPCRETRLTSWQGGERRGMDGRLQARQGGGRSTTATCEVCDWHLACAAPPSPFPLLSLFTIRPPHGLRRHSASSRGSSVLLFFTRFSPFWALSGVSWTKPLVEVLLFLHNLT